MLFVKIFWQTLTDNPQKSYFWYVSNKWSSCQNILLNVYCWLVEGLESFLFFDYVFMGCECKCSSSSSIRSFIYSSVASHFKQDWFLCTKRRWILFNVGRATNYIKKIIRKTFLNSLKINKKERPGVHSRINQTQLLRT